jgi:hypothetical protein
MTIMKTYDGLSSSGLEAVTSVVEKSISLLSLSNLDPPSFLMASPPRLVARRWADPAVASVHPAKM